jgi:hypothetical protein
VPTVLISIDLQCGHLAVKSATLEVGIISRSLGLLTLHFGSPCRLMEPSKKRE